MKTIYITSAFYRLVLIGTAIGLFQSIIHFKEVPILIISALFVGTFVAYLNHRKRSKIEMKISRLEGERVLRWLV
jgi:hypothetical protein